MRQLSFFCTLLFASLHPGSALNLTVDGTDGSYTIGIDGVTWFKSGATSYMSNHQLKSTSDSSLKLENVLNGDGSDKMGLFKLTRLTWDQGNPTNTTHPSRAAGESSSLSLRPDIYQPTE